MNGKSLSKYSVPKSEYALSHKGIKNPAAVNRGETVLEIIKKKQKLCENPINQKRYSVLSACSPDNRVKTNDFGNDLTSLSPDTSKRFHNTINNRPVARDASSFDAAASSQHKSQFKSVTSKRIGLNKTFKSTQMDQMEGKNKQKLMDRKHAKTCSQQPSSELKDFKIYNTVSFKRTEPKQMKNTGIFSKDKTGKLGLGLGWAQKKNNK